MFVHYKDKALFLDEETCLKDTDSRNKPCSDEDDGLLPVCLSCVSYGLSIHVYTRVWAVSAVQQKEGQRTQKWACDQEKAVTVS